MLESHFDMTFSKMTALGLDHLVRLTERYFTTRKKSIGKGYAALQKSEIFCLQDDLSSSLFSVGVRYDRISVPKYYNHKLVHRDSGNISDTHASLAPLTKTQSTNVSQIRTHHGKEVFRRTSDTIYIRGLAKKAAWDMYV